MLYEVIAIWVCCNKVHNVLCIWTPLRCMRCNKVHTESIKTFIVLDKAISSGDYKMHLESIKTSIMLYKAIAVGFGSALTKCTWNPCDIFCTCSQYHADVYKCT